MANQTLYLTGFMGSGKSTIGRLIAQITNRPFLDLDDEIVRLHGPIPDLFKTHGETWFRQTEDQVLRGLAGGSVIALGGGAFMTPSVRSHISTSGLAIFLDWPFPVLLARIQNDPNRPLAATAGQDALQELHNARLPIYRQADLVQSCRDGHNPQAIARSVISLLKDNPAWSQT